MASVGNSTRSERKPDLVTEFIHSLLHADPKYYDPVKAHEYYLKTRELKGRQSGAGLTSKQKEAFSYSKSEIQKAQTADTEAARAEHQSKLQAIRDVAAQLSDEITQKFSDIFAGLSQQKDTSVDSILAEKKLKVDAINSQLKMDLKSIDTKKSKDLDGVASRKKEALAQLREKTQRELDAVPPVPKGVSKEQAAKLAEERSAKLDDIRGTYSKKRQEVSDSFDEESDSIRQSAQNDKDKARDKASDDKEFVNTQASDKRTAVSSETAKEKNQQRANSSEERAQLMDEVSAAIDEATSQYETLVQELKAKYEGEINSEYDAIKRTVR